MAEEPIEIPRKEWYHFRDWFTRMDEELAVLIKINKEMLLYLKFIAGVEVPEIPPPPAPPAPPELRPVTDRLDTIIAQIDRDYPDFITDIPIDTSKATWQELKISGTGFSIISVGGGFEFKVPSATDTAITAVAGDKYDFAFTNIYVKGSGTAGTGEIRYWSKE